MMMRAVTTHLAPVNPSTGASHSFAKEGCNDLHLVNGCDSGRKRLGRRWRSLLSSIALGTCFDRLRDRGHSRWGFTVSRWLIRPLTFACAIFAGSPVVADIDLRPDRISLTGFSHQGSRDGYQTPGGAQRDWTEFNPGLVLSYDLDAIHSLTLAAFQNSYDGLGLAVTIDQVWLRGENWDLGLFSGLAHYDTYGASQVTSYANLGDAYADYFLVGGVRARYGHLELRHTPADGQSTSMTSLSLVLDINPNQPTGSIGQSVFGLNF